MKKEFARGLNNKVLNSDGNVAKMNIIEYIYCEVFHWNIYGTVLKGLIENIIETSEALCALIVQLALIVLLPIILPIQALVDIKRTKKRIARKRGVKNGY